MRIKNSSKGEPALLLAGGNFFMQFIINPTKLKFIPMPGGVSLIDSQIYFLRSYIVYVYGTVLVSSAANSSFSVAFHIFRSISGK
jgi:hypothetical protein